MSWLIVYILYILYLLLLLLVATVSVENPFIRLLFNKLRHAKGC